MEIWGIENNEINMNNAIISIPGITPRELAYELGIPVYIKRRNITEFENVIRWGSTRPLTISGIELNKAESIKLASDKAKCRQFLAENNIPVPELTEDKFPVIGRPAKHSRGKGFLYCTNKAEVEYAKSIGSKYFSQFYPKQNEYRIHIGSGRCLLMSIKEGNKSSYVWNHNSGFTFRHLKRSVWLNDSNLREMVRTAKKALKVIGLDFGGVDIMADAGDGFPPFVLSEVNTSPALSPLAVSKYVKYFNEQLGIEAYE